MFWKFNFGSSGQIDTLLQKEGVTLSELMEEEELLQECKAQNKKLIEFLSRDEVLEEIVRLVVQEPPSDAEVTTRFKRANLATELLTCEVPAMIDKLVASTQLLEMLYTFLHEEKPLNPLRASFFSRVLGMLMQRRTEQIFDFLKSKGDFVHLVVDHVGTSSVMDLMSKLVSDVEEENGIRHNIHQWLSESQLVEKLINKLSPTSDSEEHVSVEQLLCEIIGITLDPESPNQSCSPLLLSLQSEGAVNCMLDFLLTDERNNSSVMHIINVLLALLVKEQPPVLTVTEMAQPEMSQDRVVDNSESVIEEAVPASESVLSEQKMPSVATIITQRLPQLQNLLLYPPKNEPLKTSYGDQVERLGSTRLQVVALVTTLISTGSVEVHETICQLGTVNHLLDLFFKFSLNNLLHTSIEQCISAILSLPPPAPVIPSPIQSMAPGKSHQIHPLLDQLFGQCRLPDRIIDEFQAPPLTVNGKPLVNLKGYMGHLTQMANSIVQRCEEGGSEGHICFLLQGCERWNEFVGTVLAKVNLANEINQLPVMKSSHLDSDDSDEETHFNQPNFETAFSKQGNFQDDLETPGEMRFADDEFKDSDDALSGPLQRLSTQTLGLGMETCQGGMESGMQQELFEKMCEDRDTGDQWKEREITFQIGGSDLHSNKWDDVSSSSSEEENGEKMDEKMDVDQDDDWSEVFDRKSSGSIQPLPAAAPFNPWEAAAASDTSDAASWADFRGTGAFPIADGETFLPSAEVFLPGLGTFPSSDISFPSAEPCPEATQGTFFVAQFEEHFGFSTPSTHGNGDPNSSTFCISEIDDITTRELPVSAQDSTSDPFTRQSEESAMFGMKVEVTDSEKLKTPFDFQTSCVSVKGATLDVVSQCHEMPGETCPNGVSEEETPEGIS